MLIIKLTKSESGVCGARLADSKTDADEGILQVSDSSDTPTLPATESPEEQAQKDTSYLVSIVALRGVFILESINGPTALVMAVTFMCCVETGQNVK